MPLRATKSAHTAAYARWRVTTLLCLLTILSAGCELTTENGLSPTAPSALASLFVGEWTSSSTSGLPAPDSCSNLQWTLTQQSATTYAGSFSATCADGVEVQGTLTGTLVDDVLNISGSGTATPPGSTGCAFTLNGTARVVDNTIQLDYTGSTCLGQVSGTEILYQA